MAEAISLQEKQLSNLNLKRFVSCCTLFIALFGPFVGNAEADYTAMCSIESNGNLRATNLRETMCGASGTDMGDTNGMCQPELEPALWAHCGTVVSLMTSAISFETSNSSQVEQLIKNVADGSRRVLDSVVPDAKNNITLYSLINGAVNDGAEGLIVLALAGNFNTQNISPNKASDFLIKIMGILRSIIKKSILPSPTFAESCVSAVNNGNAPRFMSNAETCRVVSQVALDLVYNNAVAINGIYSRDPRKIAKGILGLTNTAGDIWAKNIDLVADIGQDTDKVRRREISTLVFDFANNYWPIWVRQDLDLTLKRGDYLDNCNSEVYSQFLSGDHTTLSVAGYLRWVTGLDHNDWAGQINGQCLTEFDRWKKYTDEGKYESLLVALGRSDKTGYDELVARWFNPESHQRYVRAWSVLSSRDEILVSSNKISALEYYRKAIEAGMINGTAARALFGAGNPGRRSLMENIFTVLDDIDGGNGNPLGFIACLNEFEITNAQAPTFSEFARCMSRGLALSTIRPEGSQIKIYLGNWSGFNFYGSEAIAFMQAAGIKNFDSGDLIDQMSEGDMIYFGVRIKQRLELSMTLWQTTVTNR